MNRLHDARRLSALSALPLLGMDDPARVVAWRHHRPITAAHFLAHVQAVAASLPEADAVNLCEDRYAFLVAFAALVVRGRANLLPSSRAPRAVAEVMAAHPGCYALGDVAPSGDVLLYHRLPELTAASPAVDLGGLPKVPATQIAAVVYTSGSTGTPRPNPKSWASLQASTRGNLGMLQAVLGDLFNIVATVPPQHTFGMEMSVLLPLFGTAAVHDGQPFFPADIASTLAQVPAPRLLVTTPIHLRALIEAQVALPPLAALLSATAPLPPELAAAAEARFAAPVLEVFGSTETCAIASRQVNRDARWSLYPGVRLQPQPDGTLVEAPQLSQSIALADIVTLHDRGRRFVLRGRHADLLEIAGKRASLGDLTQRLLAIPGVRDGVVFQLDEADAIGVRRIAALVVAPELDEQAIHDALRTSVDAVFLPRPLRLVEALPRNETGKLPRAALLALLQNHA